MNPGPTVRLRGAVVDPEHEDRLLLAEVALFAGLDLDELIALARAASHRRLHAGEVLFAEGDRGDSLYVVRSGRAEMLVDGVVVRTHGRGSVFGELAPLVGGRRTARVIARRDTDLLVLERPGVDRFLTHPVVVTELLRLVARQLPGAGAPPPTPLVNAVVTLVPGHPGLPPDAVLGIAERLVAALGGPADVARLDVGGRAPLGAQDWAGLLDRAEADRRQVVLVSTTTEDDWARFCLRQADRALVLVDPARPAPTHRVWPGSAQLVAWHRGPSPALSEGGWDAAFPRSAVHHLDAALSPGPVGRLARRITGRGLGLVLSGGGARGLAHIGVLEVLAREGIVVDRLGGTSMGAVVAGLAALDLDPDEMVETARRELIGARPFGDVTWPRHALIRGRRLDRCLARTFGAARLEDLARPVFAVSADLVSARAVVHRRGPLAEAVGLSVRLPGITPPRRIGSRLHVDGGVLDNLPIGPMADDGEGPVVACDVAMPYDAPAEMEAVGRRRGLPRMVDTIGRSMTLASWSRADRDRVRAHTVITPDLGGIGMFDFGRVEQLVDAGRRAAEAALPQLAGFALGSRC